MSCEQVTLGHHRCFEDLVQLAAAQYWLADQFCGTCRNFHALWPYLRTVRVVGAAESGGAALELILAVAFSAGCRKVLIAGTAGTGLLALSVRAGRRR